MTTFGLTTRPAARTLRGWAFWRQRQPRSLSALALVEPTPDWEPLPLDVAEWMGMNTYAPRESRSA
ncbi:MAG: hypothetical protein JWN22_41 [Nocardioides sp.]|nr:hypothetical protein [Nocardioides sp.]